MEQVAFDKYVDDIARVRLGASLALLIDGEGCIDVDRAYSPRIGITNTCRPVLEQVASWTGTGRIYRVNRRGYSQEKKVKEAYRWVVTGQKAVDVLRIAAPYLLIKQEQALLLVDWKPGRKGKRVTEEELERRKDLKARLQELKKLT